MKWILITAFLLIPLAASADSLSGDYLVKFKPGKLKEATKLSILALDGGKFDVIDDQWIHLRVAPQRAIDLEALRHSPGVEYAQPNYRLHLIEDYSALAKEALKNDAERSALNQWVSLFSGAFPVSSSKPALPGKSNPGSGPDPLTDNQWGMKSIHATEAWNKFKGSEKMVVAVIDTGVDYTHEDLVDNLWRNPKEIPDNGIDDDGNGFIDDVIGWDFVENDNRPFDVAVDPSQIIFGGGNPGHGTHCAGNVGARGSNGKGISGASPQVSIMAMRFLNEQGQGTTADAVKAINYAVKNGAKVLSNSWGSEGEDTGEDNQALKDSITNAMNHDVLFIAAAGNGHQGVGYDNDTDPRPGIPASYNIPNIISVAAIDSSDRLASFSNWGRKTVHVGAPGVAVYSTTVGGKYSDTIIDGMGMKVTWDGTSMATPHVAGAAALVWAAHPGMTYADVKNKLLTTVDKIPSLAGKSVSEGKINVSAALN